MTLVNEDHEEAASVLDEIITSGYSQDIFVAMAHEFATRQEMIRSKVQQKLEFLEEAIYRARAFLTYSLSCLFDLENAT